MTRYAAGDDGALGHVYDCVASPLFKFLVGMTREATLAEDLVHETFLRIHRARGLYHVGAPVLPWAFAIARRLFLDTVRSRKRESLTLDARDDDRPSDPGVPSPDAPADETLDARRLEARVEQVLARIPETQATAFRLLKQEGLSVAEAALVLGTTGTAVKLRAHRAYEALRAELGDAAEREPKAQKRAT